MIKQLYTVKHTSAGRDVKIPPPVAGNKINPLGERPQDENPLQSDAAKLSTLWEKIDHVRWKRMKANILSWQQIDKADIRNLVSSLVNRRKLSLNAS